MKKTILCGILCVCMALLSACTMLSEEKIKLRDLDFTVLSEDKIPEQLKSIIEEKKAQPFQITYTDNVNLYICIGYGEQETPYRDEEPWESRAVSVPSDMVFSFCPVV